MTVVHVVHIVMGFRGVSKPEPGLSSQGTILKAFDRLADAEAFVQSYAAEKHGYQAITIESVELEP
jgi:hypothetical protein